MKTAKTPKKLKEMQYPPQKKKLLKRKGNGITPAKTNAPILQTSSERLKLTIQNYQMRNKELKNEAWITSRGNIKSIFASKVYLYLYQKTKR